MTGNVRSGADDELLLCGRVCQHRGLSLTAHWSQAGEEMAADALGCLEHPQSDNISDGDICSSRQGGDLRLEISQDDKTDLFHCRARSSPTFSPLDWASTASCASTLTSRCWVRALPWGLHYLQYLQSPLATPWLWSYLWTNLHPTSHQTTLHHTTLHPPTQVCPRLRMKSSTSRRRNLKTMRLRKKERSPEILITNTFHRSDHSKTQLQLYLHLGQHFLSYVNSS